MVSTTFYAPKINKSFNKFIKKYNKIINFIFNIVKKFKPNSVNAYRYSNKNPPSNPLYKYTDKLYIACIIHITLYSSSWTSFLGPIPGDQVHKRHMQYTKYNLYNDFFDSATSKTIKFFEKKNKNTVKYISTDTTVNNNKLCKEVNKHYPCNKNRKGAKVSFLVNNRNIIIGILVGDSAIHDSKFAIRHINDFFNRKHIKRLIKKHKNKLVFLADSAYDTKEIKEKLRHLHIRFVIKPNNRRTKDPSKKRYLNRDQKVKYKKRINIEHSFGIIKKYPKINCVYESTIKSYTSLVNLVAGIMNLKKIT